MADYTETFTENIPTTTLDYSAKAIPLPFVFYSRVNTNPFTFYSRTNGNPVVFYPRPAGIFWPLIPEHGGEISYKARLVPTFIEDIPAQTLGGPSTSVA